MSSFLMSFQSLSNLGNWFYFENDTHGTYKQCKKLILEYLNKITDTEKEEFINNWNKEFSKMLYDTNCYAINQRYGDDLNNLPEFQYKEPKRVNKIQCLKSVQCWLYQCAEGDIDTTQIYKLMERIERILLNSIITELEEYKTARWE